MVRHGGGTNTRLPMSQMKLGDGEAAGLPVNHPSQSIYLVGQMPDPACVKVRDSGVSLHALNACTPPTAAAMRQ